jgi:hypothetical protein
LDKTSAGSTVIAGANVELHDGVPAGSKLQMATLPHEAGKESPSGTLRPDTP